MCGIVLVTILCEGSLTERVKNCKGLTDRGWKVGSSGERRGGLNLPLWPQAFPWIWSQILNLDLWGKSSGFLTSRVKLGVPGPEAAIPENREMNKMKFSFFSSKHALSTSFNIFVVTNFLPKLVDILLLSTEKNWISIFWIPLFLGIASFQAGPHRARRGAAPRFCYSTKQGEKRIWCGCNIRIYQRKPIALPRREEAAPDLQQTDVASTTDWSVSCHSVAPQWTSTWRNRSQSTNAIPYTRVTDPGDA